MEVRHVKQPTTPLIDNKEPEDANQPETKMEINDQQIEDEQVGTPHIPQIENIEIFGPANADQAKNIHENQLADLGEGQLTATAPAEDVVQENRIMMGHRQDGIRRSRRILLQQDNALVGMP